ncbi:MAG TPA: hypothetical protein VMS55_25790 [Myxococcota bacterium]|nr:hypothetical protein [Myxococcota bacterium]
MAGVRSRNQKKESNTGLLLVVLLALVGLGAWNYHRNVAVERSVKPGPYASVPTKDLDVLIAAYRSEVDALKARGGTGLRATAHSTSGVGNGVREFERVQRTTQKTREAGYEISEREGAIAAIENEKSRRAASGEGGTPWMLFLKRAFTVTL